MQCKTKESASDHDYVPDDGDDDEWWEINAVEVEVIVSQIEAMKAVVQDLPIDTHVVDN